MLRAGAVVLAVLIAAAGVFGLVRFFQGRDDATFSSVEGPGRLEPDRGNGRRAAGDAVITIPPPTSGPHVRKAIPRDGVALDDDQVLSALEAGDVVLVYGEAGVGKTLRSLADDLVGSFDPDLAAAGQAVILDRVDVDSVESVPPVTALAWRHRLELASPEAPELREFIEFWLGRGAG